MKNTKNDSRSYLLAGLAAMLWGTTAAVGKIMLQDLDSLQVLFYASLIATIFLFGLVVVRGKLAAIRACGLKSLVRFAYMGFLGVFLYYAFLYAGLQNAPAQQAFVVNYTWPIWVIVFASLLLGERLTPKKILAILLGFLGVYVVVTEGNLLDFSLQHLLGDIFALSGAVVYGLFSALSKKHDDDRTVSTMFYYLFAFGFTVIFAPLFTHIPAITPNQLPGLLWLGAMTSGLAFVFWLSALKYGDTAKMSNIIFMTPFLSLIYIYLLTGETIRLSSVIGCGLIVSGILIQSSQAKTKETASLT